MTGKNHGLSNVVEYPGRTGTKKQKMFMNTNFTPSMYEILKLISEKLFKINKNKPFSFKFDEISN